MPGIFIPIYVNLCQVCGAKTIILDSKLGQENYGITVTVHLTLHSFRRSTSPAFGLIDTQLYIKPAPTPLRAGTNFPKRFNVIFPVQSPCGKYSA